MCVLTGLGSHHSKLSSTLVLAISSLYMCVVEGTPFHDTRLITSRNEGREWLLRTWPFSGAPFSRLSSLVSCKSHGTTRQKPEMYCSLSSSSEIDQKIASTSILILACVLITLQHSSSRVGMDIQIRCHLDRSTVSASSTVRTRDCIPPGSGRAFLWLRKRTHQRQRRPQPLRTERQPQTNSSYS